MSLSLERAEEFLTIRNECFMKADLDAYLYLWSDEGAMELNKDGKMVYLRDYFDASDGQRPSALHYSKQEKPLDTIRAFGILSTKKKI